VVGTFSQSIEHDDIQYSLQLDPDNEVEAIFLLKLDKGSFYHKIIHYRL